MKKLIGFGILATLLVALPLTHTALAKGHKVAICHFTGHTPDPPVTDFDGDFDITGTGKGCLDRGGEIIEVSIQGWCNGHWNGNPANDRGGYCR